ncbi:mannosyltransferase [Bosea sp. Root483D1]|uniref:ABC transporter ATP-binding protein n=1 Tax=Bosea sp. Root483D1 TaxID=1736544 RepID=UPI00070DCF0C|nr:ABC transporter ATP-binding protein [Bosea sp. Root483D1]KRE20831.1 mannosyltransferase [Bosea sp. Root483D1]
MTVAMQAVAAPKIGARHVSKHYPTVDGVMVALEDFSLDVADGEFVCIVGPSGCGKSTFLRMVAGLESISQGAIEIRPGTDAAKPLNSVVFQEYAIFPWKTLADNVAFGLQMRGVGRKERLDTARFWLDRVGLSKFADYYPHQISGGMKQRVSIIRALANDPEVLLMDEPLGALDAQTRVVIQEELLRIWEETRKTVLYITHSLDEAVLLGDRVILMSAQPGRHLATFKIDLPRPRSIATTNLPRFAEYRAAIWEQLSAEVTRAMEVRP